MKPTQILAKLCKDGKLDPPVYEYGRVKIGRSVFNMPMHDSELFSDVDLAEEQMALLVLRRWHEVPRVGARLVPEHVETRPLYNPNKPGTDDQRVTSAVFYQAETDFEPPGAKISHCTLFTLVPMLFQSNSVQ